MFFTGILYLLFEDAIIGHHDAKSPGSSPLGNLGSRVIMGMQVHNVTAGFAEQKGPIILIPSDIGWHGSACLDCD